MNEESIYKQIRQYKDQIIAVFVVILALIIYLTVLDDLIKLAKGLKDESINKSILKRGEIIALLYLVVTIYFTYVAYKTYLKNKNNTNLNYLIALLLVLIACIIRYITTKRTSDSYSDANII